MHALLRHPLRRPPPIFHHLRAHATHLRPRTTPPLPPPPPRPLPLHHRLPPSFRTTLYTLLLLLSYLPAISFLTTHIISILPVTGPSMSPFLNTTPHTSTTRDRLLLLHWNASRNLHRGELVAFYSPRHPEVLAIKRVVALEGDRVVTRKGGAFGEGEAVDVEVGHVWVEGDAGVERSTDSNSYGAVSRSLIVGRAVGVVWPWGRRGWIRWEDYGGCPRVMEGVNRIEPVEFY